ncbi:MAG: aspartyl protease family protein, partial [Acidobacteria bacterium]|nr:aspartyl protease family protein [Acidobacteriota bacterium]
MAHLMLRTLRTGRTRMPSVLLCSVLSINTFARPWPAGNNFASAEGLDADLKEFRIEKIESALRRMPAGPEHDYFAGVLANRAGHLEDSIRLLNNALPTIRKSESERAAIALEALADDYNKSFRYGDAARTYDDLLSQFGSQFDQLRLQGTKDDARVMHLLGGAPAQTITWRGPVQLKTKHNPIGSIVTELQVNGTDEQWLLDTGANFSVVSRGFARRLGLKPLPGFGQTQAGVTGVENRLQVAVLPTLPIGGATLHNVIVLILDDSSLRVRFDHQTYQINAIVGYPVLQALQTITFLHDDRFQAGGGTTPPADGTPMYMKLMTPVIACVVQGSQLAFSLDTGASTTNLSVRYYQRFRTQAATWMKAENQSFGAGGVVRKKIYIQPKLDLLVGNETAKLEHVTVFSEPMGSGIDELYGNLGQDLVARFKSFTLDFSRMIFSLGPPLGPVEKAQPPGLLRRPAETSSVT